MELEGSVTNIKAFVSGCKLCHSTKAGCSTAIHEKYVTRQTLTDASHPAVVLQSAPPAGLHSDLLPFPLI